MRYAVYFTPDAGHPLWQAGCKWLGRDAVQPAAVPPTRSHLGSPWRYGFHATLKAPCHLAPGVTEADWLGAVQALAQQQRAFPMPALQVAMLGDFLALRPLQAIDAAHALRRLADACVLQLERWRAPLTPPEHERQCRAAHSARQREHVQRLGYAHVLDDWRFHMTLSDSLGSVPEADVQALCEQAQAHFAPALSLPLLCNALSVFVEPAPGHPFVLAQRFGFGHA